jgi:hypothetical protein
VAKRPRGAQNENAAVTNPAAQVLQTKRYLFEIARRENAVRFHDRPARVQSLNRRYDPYVRVTGAAVYRYAA